MDKKEITLRISFFRNKKGMTARELSLTIGKSESYINRLEARPFNIPVTTMFDILSALEVEPEEFFATNYKTFKRDNELYNTILTLSKEKREHLMALIKKD